MSEHKYKEAYKKGYRDGQKAQCLADAIDDALAMLDKVEVTNGDMIKAMFPNAIININELGSIVHVKYNNHTCWVNYELDWWNAPYKESEHDN